MKKMLFLLLVGIAITILLILTSNAASKNTESGLGTSDLFLRQVNSLPLPKLSPSDLVNLYDWDKALAYRVMRAESGGNPTAVNWSDYHPAGNCYGSFGLFQLACFRGTIEELKDPETNVRLAYELWLRKDGTFIYDWGACRSLPC